MKIIIFTHLCLDRNTSEKLSYVNIGSPGFYMTKAFQKFNNTQVEIISNYGKDLLPYLKNFNIYPETNSSETSLIYENISNNNGRYQKAINRDRSKPVEINESLVSKIREADIIIIAPLLPNFSIAYINSILKIASRQSLKLLIPQGFFREFDKENNVIFREFIEEEILRNFDFVILSENEFPNLKMVARNWIRKNQALKVIITRGEKGSEILTESTKLQIKPYRLSIEEIVDSVGSGEIFSAAFIYDYFINKDLWKAGDFGAKISSLYLKYSPKQFDEIKF